MRNLKKAVCSLALVAAMLTASGCGNKINGPFIGNWAYVHDTAATILSLEKDGDAKYQGNEYTYTADDEYFYLKSDKEEIKLRYKMNGDKLYIYQTTQYEYSGEGSPDGIIGYWVCGPKKWSFEFTDQGTFKEDSYFPGYYTIDENEKTVKLVYNDHFEDTVFYYSIDGNTLTIEYPWETVPTQKAEKAK